MKNENLKLSKLESIQMSNFLMKMELISYLKDKNKINPKNYELMNYTLEYIYIKILVVQVIVVVMKKLIFKTKKNLIIMYILIFLIISFLLFKKMKNENLKLSKLESIQMSNFLMKKELISYLKEKNEIQINKKQYTIFITDFIEDLFNIINQQILNCAQIYQIISNSQIDHLISNNKNISFSMILNFYDKIISFFNSTTNKINMSRNFSNNDINNKRILNLTDRDSYNKNIFEFEKKYFEKRYKSNFNSPQNRYRINNKENRNNNNQSNILLLSSQNSTRNLCVKNIKIDYMDLNKLEKNSEKDDIQIFVKQQKNKEYNNIKKVNNKIVLTKQIYKICNSIPVPRKNNNNITERKNSYNKKIKNNKINLKKSKNSWKRINVSNSEDDKK